jgi:hypothetical protein
MKIWLTNFNTNKLGEFQYKLLKVFICNADFARGKLIELTEQLLKHDWEKAKNETSTLNYFVASINVRKLILASGAFEFPLCINRTFTKRELAFF